MFMKIVSTLVISFLLVGCLPAETVQDSPVAPPAAAESVSALPTPTRVDVRPPETTEETEEVAVTADERIIQEVVRRLADFWHGSLP
jgi:uncharacterized lipoprotein YajG